MAKTSENKLISLIREASGDSYYLHEIDDIITLLKQEIVDQILKGNSVELYSLGVFSPQKVKERLWNDPKTGNKRMVGGYTKPVFKMSNALVQEFKKETRK